MLAGIDRERWNIGVAYLRLFGGNKSKVDFEFLVASLCLELVAWNSTHRTRLMELVSTCFFDKSVGLITTMVSLEAYFLFIRNLSRASLHTKRWASEDTMVVIYQQFNFC